MKTLTFFILTLIIISPLYSQSSIIFEAGTHIEVHAGANISADNVMILGTYSGGGTINGLPIPVELTSFTASFNDNSVSLIWETASEKNNMGFEVQRSALSTSSAWGVIGFVEGAGTSTEKQNYSFSDIDVSSGKYLYRLKQIDFDGTSNFSDEIEVDVSLPVEFSLSQNYPNPFNPTTTIRFAIPIESHVRIIIYDVLGNEVMTLLNEVKKPGYHEIKFNTQKDGKEISSGIYFYVLTADNFSQIKKMILLR